MDQRILLILNDPLLAEDISLILKLAQYQIIEAKNGIEGVEKAIGHLPDLIISSVLLPELNGYGVIQILSHNERTKEIPFVFISNKGTSDDIRTGMNFGADDYITLPFEAGDLLKAIEVRLQKRCNSSVMREVVEQTDESHSFVKTNDLNEFFESKPIKYVSKKDRIFSEGQFPGSLFLIKSGKVKNFRTDSYGKDLIIDIRSAGDFLGYLPLLKNSAYGESSEALEALELFTIPRIEFLSLLQSDLKFCQAMIDILSKELVDVKARLVDLAYKPVRQRAAKILLYLGNQFEVWENSGTIHMSRKDISNIIGTATETLNRTLAEFRDEGLIDTNENGLAIKDKKKLTKVARS